MSINPEEEIWKEVWKKYNKNPLGLKMYAGISSTGHPELLISSPDESWMIKRDSIYSGKSGIGGRVKENIQTSLKIEQAGLRPIPRNLMKKMIAMVEGGIDILDATKIIEDILTQEPTTFDEIERIKPAAVIQGPILQSQKPLQSIIGGQLELDLKLDAELERLRRRFSYIQ